MIMFAFGSTSAIEPHTSVRRGVIVAGSAIFVVVAFLFQFLTTEFTNDHFVHLSRGWQILAGEVPIRDFFDPGLFLQYYASAVTLLWSGHNLFGEAIVTQAFIAAGAGLTFVAATRLSSSVTIASVATLIAILSTPRLYGYPKVFFYALAIVVGWLYAHAPGHRWRNVLAGVTALAFLFRYDHGVYIGLATTALLVITHWPDPRRILTSVSLYALLIVGLLTPFLAFVQMTTGLTRYAASLTPQAQRVSTFQVNWLPIAVDPSAPWLEVSPPAERRVNIRWAADLDDAARGALEAKHGLIRADHVEESTWSYVLADESRDRVRALVAESAVADTHGIDRARAELDIQEPLYLRLVRRIPLLRWHIAPGIVTRENALAWWYYVTLLLPAVCLAVLLARLSGGSIGRAEAAVVGMTTLLSLVVVQTLVRGSPDSRLADVANPICVLGAWLAASILAAGRTRRWMRFSSTALVLFLTILTFSSVVIDARVLTSLEISRIPTGPVGIWDRMGVVSGRLRGRPIDAWDREDAGLPGLGRYVFECTAPTDRLFVPWFAPQLFFYTERAFAGGQVYLRPNWHASVEDQRLTIERLERERVPIVIEAVKGDYPAYFPLVFDYIRERYREVPLTSAKMEGFRVLVDRHLSPTGTYEPLNLPCYR